MENICYGLEEKFETMPEEEVLKLATEACQNANAWEFIMDK